MRSFLCGKKKGGFIMKVSIIEDLVTRPVPRSTFAPWLGRRSNKTQLAKRFVFKVTCDKRQIDEIFVVPEGYISDWSSIPRLLWFIFPPNYSEARHGAVAHDYVYSHLYWHYDKKFADELIRAFMVHKKANWFARTAFYYSVRIGGRGGWKNKDQKGAHPHWKERHEKIPYDSSDSVSS